MCRATECPLWDTGSSLCAQAIGRASSFGVAFRAQCGEGPN